MQENSSGSFGTVTHAVGMGVTVIVERMVMTEGMGHATGVTRTRETQQVSQVLPSLFHAHCANKGHAALQEYEARRALFLFNCFLFFTPTESIELVIFNKNSTQLINSY